MIGELGNAKGMKGTPRNNGSSSPDWMGDLYAQNAFSNIFIHYLNLSYFINFADRLDEWTPSTWSMGNLLPWLFLTHIAETCGFSSTNYFQQVFKKKVGFAPGEYRLKTKYKS
jgi:hypothetical protein